MTTLIEVSLLVLFLLITCCKSSNHEGFLAIAHMTHTKHTVKIAMDSGANALEADLNFNKTTGQPTRFYHGPPCDCSCYKPIKIFLFKETGGNLCLAQKDPCNSRGQYKEVFNEMLKYPKQLALIYIDCKINGFSDSLKKKAAYQTIQMLDRDLFMKGYRGKVLVGSGRDKYMLRSLVHYSITSDFKSRVYFSLDWNNKGIDDTLTFLTSLSTHNIVFAQGNYACHPSTYHKVTRTASANKANGVVSKVIVWTIDHTKSFPLYYSFGARGIITNRIGALMNWVRENRIRLAVPGDNSLMPAKNKKPIFDPTCKCKYSKGGCVISQLPPKNTGCQCQKKLFYCSGRVTMCTDPTSRHCKRPAYTAPSCLQGGGNCDGYMCDCSYKLNWFSGGCKVSRAAPRHTACSCSKRLLSCHGHVVSCKNENSFHCAMPDKSKESCMLGGGNCNGY